MRLDRIETPAIFCVLLAAGGALSGAGGQVDHAERGSQRFMEFCAACHGADGKGGDKAPALISALSATQLSEGELYRIVRDGTRGGMPPFAQIGDTNIRAVVEYVRTLQGETEPASVSAAAAMPGDAQAGRELFFGKAQCSECHMVQGKGGFMAGGLTRYGRNRTADAIRSAITNPDAPLVPSSQVASVTTKTGQRLTGVLRNEDNFTLELETEDGRYYSLERSDLKQVRYTGHSSMPRDYGRRLTAGELDDIVSYLMATSLQPRTAVGQNP